MTISADRVREVFNYCPSNGSFKRIKKTGNKGRVGDFCGTVNSSGYVVIGIDGKVYYAHRLAWLYMKGYMPDQIDHADGDRSNNKWSNLRKANHSENIMNSKRAKNNTSGFKGVSWHRSAKKWSAQIYRNGRSKYLGLFERPEDAHQAYMDAAKNFHPDFARAS